jgi:1,2-diacylglycerol-3-alpha-glucose alpha-1,2-galactosyltransferase
MRSSATDIKGQGVGACYEELVRLVQNGLPKNFQVLINSPKICDIMHYHTVNFGYYIERLTRGRKAVNIGYVHFLPDTLDDSLRLNWLVKKIFYKYLINFYNSMDYLVTVNPSIIEKIKQYDLNRPKLLCIPNFVSEQNFFPIEQDKIPALREKHGLPQNKFIALGVGQLQTRKGVFDFIETAKKTPGVHFAWAGGFSFGKLTDGYDEIKKLVANPPENVSFIGMVDREEMNEVYNAADVMFLPSFDELFPMAILEALACKKPVLLRDIDVYKEILFDHCPKAADADGFSAHLRALSADSGEYARWCEESWQCHKKYDEESALKMWEKFYTSIYNKAHASDAVLREGTL